MLSNDFTNGKRLNLSTSLAIFTVVMGFLFWESAEGGSSNSAAMWLILFGCLWYFADHIYHWWEKSHHS